ncbi:MAG TPA: glycosyltransferase [Ktedonobacterales bacterium]|jgi:glycosyltransferase involved in cell wall biosynthesis
MKVALVHDYLNQMGGAERVLLALHGLYPHAPIFTSIYDPERVDPAFRRLDIRSSFMQRLPFVSKHHQSFLMLYPLAFERLDLRDYDLILSSSSAFAKGVVSRPDALHICYCHTPMRWAWSYQDYIEHEKLCPPARVFLPFFIRRLRQWDQATAGRVDHFIANSPGVAQRIAAYYRHDATVIPPPVETARYSISPTQDDYFLVISRLAPYKRIDIAIEAFNRLRLPLKIIGVGRDRARLERFAGPTIEFLGWLPDQQARQYLAQCQALIHPGAEDFGLTPLEAQASGRPVIAYGAGGALTSVLDGVTGIFFHERSPGALAEAVAAFRPDQFDPLVIRRHAEDFDIARFQRRITEFIDARVRSGTRAQQVSTRQVSVPRLPSPAS